jgi:hypothetical protein
MHVRSEEAQLQRRTERLEVDIEVLQSKLASMVIENPLLVVKLQTYWRLGSSSGFGNSCRSSSRSWPKSWLYSWSTFSWTLFTVASRH